MGDLSSRLGRFYMYLQQGVWDEVFYVVRSCFLLYSYGNEGIFCFFFSFLKKFGVSKDCGRGRRVSFEDESGKRLYITMDHTGMSVMIDVLEKKIIELKEIQHTHPSILHQDGFPQPPGPDRPFSFHQYCICC